MTPETLRQRLPHTGSMVLIDQVLSYDQTQLKARSQAHQRTDNPLRTRTGLPASAALEMAAQAAALHGSLRAGAPDPKPGFLASAREIRWSQPAFDPASSEIQIEVEWLASEPQGALYRFTVTSAPKMRVEGRFMIHFPEPSPLIDA